MSIIHDVIKINLVSDGYLPNYPYHLISDEEMCDAFLKYPVDPDIDPTIGSDYNWEAYKEYVEENYTFFNHYYPCLSTELESYYRKLIESIATEIKLFKDSDDASKSLPTWVYSYMMNSVVSVNSDSKDIHDMLVLLGMDNLHDEITPEIQYACYVVSKDWLNKSTYESETRTAPTIFGELHVLKSLRVKYEDISL